MVKPKEPKNQHGDVNHPLQQQLKQDVVKEVIKHSMDAVTAWVTCKECETMHIDLWKSHLDGMHEIVVKARD